MGTKLDDDRSLREARPWTLAKVLPLLAVVAFTATSFGWFLGTRADRPAASSVDVGFLQDMHLHHRQAVHLAAVANERGGDRVRAFAVDVLIGQHRELGVMEAWLSDWGYELQGDDRTAMAWMGDPTPARQMRGLQSEADVSALQDLSGAAFDRRWLEMLRDHHLGGVHMAESAAIKAKYEKVRSFAIGMAEDQKIEINQYVLALSEPA
jgi:uncharacterized protein (DUF305 family)